MGRLRRVTHARAPIGCVLAVAVFLVLLSRASLSQDGADLATLRGTVRDAQEKSVAAATVHLQSQDNAQTLTAHADSQGGYSFPGLRAGVYTLHAEMRGYGDAVVPSLFLGPRETKNIDLTLREAKTLAPPAASARAPEFFDPPQFTVAGVTDTTSLGGHGSDTVVRTRETLAKEAASLGKSAGSETPAAAATEQSLRERIEREPLSFDANHRLGKVLLDSGKVRESLPYLEHAAEINPGDYENAYEVALANADAGNDAPARDKALALLKQRDTAEVHHLLAGVQERLGDSLDAVHEYQRAAELDPREAYLFDWGSELLLHHAPEPALKVFGQGNRRFPRSARMLIGLGAAWFAGGSYDQAVRRICQASDLDPDNSVPYLFLGRMQRAESTPSSELVDKLHRFVTLQPHNAEANYYYAVSLWKLRKSPKDAADAPQIESLLNNAIRLDPKFSAAYVQLGMLHSELRDFTKAISDYLQAVRADPEMEEAHYRLAQVYRQTAEADKAKAEFQLYGQASKESAERAERERREIRQFVYTLRDGGTPQQRP